MLSMSVLLTESVIPQLSWTYYKSFVGIIVAGSIIQVIIMFVNAHLFVSYV